MLLFLSDLHKEHLQLLRSQPLQVLVSLCKLTIDFINNGVNTPKYKIVAEKLDLSELSIQNVVQALVYLLSAACKHNLSENDFKASLSVVGFSSEMQDVLIKLYNTKRAEITQTLNKLQQRDQTLQDLTWRFEVQVASKKNIEEIKPMVTMNLTLQTSKSSINIKSNQKNKTIPSALYIDTDLENAKTASECQNVVSHVILQSDLPNLLNMTNKLEQALKESKSQHVRKVQRALQP